MSGSRFETDSPTSRDTGMPADARPAFRVAAFGLANKFQRVLEIVFRHARHNQYRFVLAGTRGPGDYDVALVDMTAEGGPEVAQTLRCLPESRPIVTVGRREDPTRACDDLTLQRFAINLLATLNRTVERNLIEPAQRGAAALARGAAALAGAADAEQVLGRRGRVLLIDESQAVRRQLSVALQQMGLDSEGVGSAREALDMGLANRVVADGEALAAAVILARQIAAFPQTCLRNDRRSAMEQWSLDWDAATAFEIGVGLETLSSGEAVAGATRFSGGEGRGGQFQ
jgi:hypothetical protein